MATTAKGIRREQEKAAAAEAVRKKNLLYAQQRAQKRDITKAEDVAREQRNRQFAAKRHPSNPSQARFYNRPGTPQKPPELKQEALADVIVGSQDKTPEQQAKQVRMFTAVAKAKPDFKEPERVSYARVKPESEATRKRLAASSKYEHTAKRSGRPGEYFQHESSNIPARTPREMLSKFPVPTSEVKALALEDFEKMSLPVQTASTMPGKMDINRNARTSLTARQEKEATSGIVPASQDSPVVSAGIPPSDAVINTWLRKLIAERAANPDPLSLAGMIPSAPVTAPSAKPADKRPLLGNQPVAAAELPPQALPSQQPPPVASPMLGAGYEEPQSFPVVDEYGIETSNKRKKETQSGIIAKLKSILAKMLTDRPLKYDYLTDPNFKGTRR